MALLLFNKEINVVLKKCNFEKSPKQNIQKRETVPSINFQWLFSWLLQRTVNVLCKWATNELSWDWLSQSYPGCKLLICYSAMGWHKEWSQRQNPAWKISWKTMLVNRDPETNTWMHQNPVLIVTLSPEWKVLGGSFIQQICKHQLLPRHVKTHLFFSPVCQVSSIQK